MKLRTRIVAPAAVVALLALVAGVAQARNPHCAGGIQYVVQGLRDKAKGNTEDYQRQMLKAVDQLTQCSTEDPKDFEALGYLGWAYAEIDSMGPAGAAFDKALEGLQGDKKRWDIVHTNRESYWATTFNEGIKKITDAQAMEEIDKAKAKEDYTEAVVRLTKAKLLKPGSAQTIRNLATAYALLGDVEKQTTKCPACDPAEFQALLSHYDAAEAVLRNGLTEAAADTAVHQVDEALGVVRANHAALLVEMKKYDEAIAYYRELAKAEPKNADHQMGLGSALFSLATSDTAAAARKANFKAAGEAYDKAAALRPTDGDLPFNAALAFQNAGDPTAAERMWRQTLKVRPDDTDAMSSFGAVLADLKKYDEATKVLTDALAMKPDNKTLYRQLGAVYTKAGNNPKATEMLTLYLAMNSGEVAADPAAAAKRLSGAAAATLSSMGTPEKVYEWDSSGQKLQTWMYLSKKQGVTFDVATGKVMAKSDWSATAAAPKK